MLKGVNTKDIIHVYLTYTYRTKDTCLEGKNSDTMEKNFVGSTYQWH